MEKNINELLLENKRLRDRINYLESAILRGDVNVPLDIISAEKIRIINSSIHEVGLSVRTRNCLMIPGIKTVGELLNWSPKQLRKIRGFGFICLHEVESLCRKFNLELKKDD